MTSHEIWRRDGFTTDPKNTPTDQIIAAWLKEIAFQLAVRNEIERSRDPASTDPLSTEEPKL